MRFVLLDLVFFALGNDSNLCTTRYVTSQGPEEKAVCHLKTTSEKRPIQINPGSVSGLNLRIHEWNNKEGVKKPTSATADASSLLQKTIWTALDWRTACNATLLCMSSTLPKSMVTCNDGQQ